MENKAKEYAQELVNRFIPYADCDFWETKSDWELKETCKQNAKQCALICLKEKYEEAKYCEVALSDFLSVMLYRKRIEFLQSVKQEIEAL